MDGTDTQRDNRELFVNGMDLKLQAIFKALKDVLLITVREEIISHNGVTMLNGAMELVTTIRDEIHG